jgi:hypothetical protein
MARLLRFLGLVATALGLNRGRLVDTVEISSNVVPLRPKRGAPSLLKSDEEVSAWFVQNRTCPDCGSSEFVNGPRGGASRNMRCANAVCSAEFNVLEVQGQYLFAQRIHWHPTERDKLN